MRPTPSLRLLGPKVKPFHDPWNRREAWRYQAPFKPDGGVLAYQTWWKPTVIAFLGWVAWDEVVKYVFLVHQGAGMEQHGAREAES